MDIYKFSKKAKRLFALLAFSGLTLLCSVAQAALNNATVTQSNFSELFGSNPFVLNFATSIQATGESTLSLKFVGDFNDASEYIEVTLEGLGLGNELNSDLGNDVFGLSKNIGCRYRFGGCDPITIIADMPLGRFNPGIADNHMSVAFDPTDEVKDILARRKEFASATVSFNSPDAVPEPGSLALLSFCLVGLGWSRYYRSQAPQ